MLVSLILSGKFLLLRVKAGTLVEFHNAKISNFFVKTKLSLTKLKSIGGGHLGISGKVIAICALFLETE